MTTLGQTDSSLDFFTISRSHLYWGRKPTNGLLRVFECLQPGDVLLDPFCGGGTAVLTALSMGARVIASDLNPMAVFLSRVLIQPVSLFALEQTFETIRQRVSEDILSHYQVQCPKCRQEIYFDYLQWNRIDGKDLPEAVKVTCKHCGFRELRPLTRDEINRQIGLSQVEPKTWFPKAPIRSHRKSDVSSCHELFTGRNLSALAELHRAIKGTTSLRCRETLHYAFTAMLYSCSQLQMFSRKSPSSSRGWTAPRFYQPPARMEKNVWKTFEVRFNNVLKCKAKLNAILGAIHISDSLGRFEGSADEAYVHRADFLKFPFPQQLPVAHVFLDPPYNDDVDYMGFSEFWGSWLGMKSPVRSGWHPGILSTEENAERIQKLLQRIRENTRPSCQVTLAYGSKRPEALQLIEEAALEAGYQIQNTSPIFFDNPQKRKANEFTTTDRYLVLIRREKQFRITAKQVELHANDIPAKEVAELTFLLQVAAYLLSNSHTKRPPSADRCREYANNLTVPALREKLALIKRSHIQEWTSDYRTNQKSYNRFCLTLLERVLSTDKFTVLSADNSHFDDSKLSGYYNVRDLPRPFGVAEGADFVAAGNGNQRAVFCFFDKGREDTLKHIANQVIKQDTNHFRTTHFLIFARHEDMIRYRQVGLVHLWPRGFFICLGELVKRVVELYPQPYGHLKPLAQKSTTDYRSEQKINRFMAEVQSNNPVRGDDESCKHFKIKFRAPELRYVVPGQFVMIDTFPMAKRKRIERRTSSWDKKGADHLRYTNLIPKSFLKRPFSIHRAFYEHFDFGYLKNVSLPANLAPVAHTVFPSRFEIFYKVLEEGVGTNELTKVRKGEKIEMLGPLGKVSELASWRAKGIGEVHLVGGGVGMAPLVFFGQALKYYSFRLKAFIGIDRIETLRYSAKFAPTFSEDAENAYVYVENLLSIGLVLNDIYVSSEVSDESMEGFVRLRKGNRHVGFVTEQYKLYLERRKKLDGVLVIVCGPEPMLRTMNAITSDYDIPMRVLLEKRMACGIGVCMSCVCKIKDDGSTKYCRVCTDGPLFDAKDLMWEQR